MSELDPNANPLVNGTACLLIHFGRPGIKRKLRDDQYVAGAAEKALTAAIKVTLDSPEYKAICAFEGSVKFWVEHKALPSKLYRTATFLIPLASMKEVDDYLETAHAHWLELVEEFVKAFPKRKAETMKRLRDIASEGDYKTAEELRSEFRFDFEYVTLQTPSTLKQISAAMFEREEQRLAARLQTAEAEIVGAYREKFAAAVQDMKEILIGTNADGKPRKFFGAKIPKLQSYIAAFKAEQNVCGDAALTGVMDEASKLLSGVDPKALKDDATWRASLGAEFGEIAKKLETMTRVRGRRQIDVDDDEAPAVPAA